MIPATQTDTQTTSETCMVCARPVHWGARWGPSWLVDRYCSERCSERRLGTLDYQLEEAVLQLLVDKPGQGPLSVSAVARFVDPLGWESLLDRAQNAARRLAVRGKVTLLGRDDPEGLLWGIDELRIRLPD